MGCLSLHPCTRIGSPLHTKSGCQGGKPHPSPLQIKGQEVANPPCRVLVVRVASLILCEWAVKLTDLTNGLHIIDISVSILGVLHFRTKVDLCELVCKFYANFTSVIEDPLTFITFIRGTQVEVTPELISHVIGIPIIDNPIVRRMLP